MYYRTLANIFANFKIAASAWKKIDGINFSRQAAFD
jgi:hypothetical protein